MAVMTTYKLRIYLYFRKDGEEVKDVTAIYCIAISYWKEQSMVL